MRRLVTWLVTLQASLSACGFLSPSFTVAWQVGDNETVTWNSTWNHYSVALWQQLGEGSAQMGRNAILYKTPSTGAPSDKVSVDWKVQLYGLDLDVSKNFFLWLCEGTPDQQGKANANMSSAYFTIKPSKKPQSTTSTASLGTSTKYSPTQTAPAPTTTPDEPQASSSPSSSTTDSQTLSTGAVAGIAAAATVVSLAALLALFLWWRYLRDKRDALHDRGNSYVSQPLSWRDPFPDGSSPHDNHHMQQQQQQYQAGQWKPPTPVSSRTRASSRGGRSSLGGGGGDQYFQHNLHHHHQQHATSEMPVYHRQMWPDPLHAPASRAVPIELETTSSPPPPEWPLPSPPPPPPPPPAPPPRPPTPLRSPPSSSRPPPPQVSVFEYD